MKSTSKPQRNSAHRKEDVSKRKLEEIIEPFYVPGWNTRDYGIDSVVEITSTPDVYGNVELESKCFLVQLKSTDKIKLNGESIAFSVPVKKILYWYNYNLPVLFVLYDLKNDNFYYQWIGEELIAKLDAQNADWSNQASVTIKIPTVCSVDRNAISEIKNYVLRWKMPARRKLEPGKYFQLKEELNHFIEEYKTLTTGFSFQSINDTINNLSTDVELSLYRIAITGPSRVGKSTLINGLLKKNVSPTGFFQTTGVPIQIIPGFKDGVTIYFHEKKPEYFDFSIDTIKQFASQDENEDNKKGVKMISVSVKNQQLERGVSLFDIPGLDDPSDEILEYTWQTVRKSNAVVYVIDASPAADGGYIFKSDYRKHITTFSQQQDKVFLVFNKIDRLSAEVLSLLKERVSIDLAKYNLNDIIGDRIFYLSAEEKKVHNGHSVYDLNERLWEFILEENKSGIVRMSLVNQELFNSSASLINILNARVMDYKKASHLKNAIDSVKKKIPDLESDMRERVRNGIEIISNSLENKKHRILSDLESSLKKVPINGVLPDSKEIKKHLISNLNITIEQTNNEFLVQINQFKNQLDKWIEQNLRLIREILSHNETKPIDFTDIETFESPQIDYSSAWGMGFIGMVAAYVFAPTLIFGAGIIGFFANLFVSAESRRAKQIGRIMETSKDKYTPVFERIKTAYTELFLEHLEFFNQYVEQKLSHYFTDLERQLSGLESQPSQEETELYRKAFTKIEELQKRLTSFDAELRSFHFSK